MPTRLEENNINSISERAQCHCSGNRHSGVLQCIKGNSIMTINFHFTIFTIGNRSTMDHTHVPHYIAKGQEYTHTCIPSFLTKFLFFPTVLHFNSNHIPHPL